MRRRHKALRRRYGHSKRARKRASLASGRHVIHNANPSRTWPNNYIFWFGAHAPTYVRAWGSSMEDALDEAADWLSDHKPGLLATEQVEDEYKRLIEEGKSEEEAWEEAQMDTTPMGGYGQIAMSEEWGIVVENPTRAQVLEIQGRLKEHRAKGTDPLLKRARRQR